jgi:hypothetical protein
MADFAALKERVSLEETMRLLDLKLTLKNGSYRGKCPVHGGDDRSLVLTPGKGFKCWASNMPGGSQLDLILHVHGKEQSKGNLPYAAQWLEEKTGGRNSTSNGSAIADTAPVTKPPAPRHKQGYEAAAYASRLDPAHASLASLNVAPETFTAFMAGFASTGLNRGRLAIALHDPAGAAIGHFGFALGDAQPRLLFHESVDPRAYVFNAHRAVGEVRLVRDPLAVMAAHEAGEAAICFLTDLVEPHQHELLAALQDQKKFSVFY